MMVALEWFIYIMLLVLMLATVALLGIALRGLWIAVGKRNQSPYECYWRDRAQAAEKQLNETAEERDRLKGQVERQRQEYCELDEAYENETGKKFISRSCIADMELTEQRFL